MPRRTLRPFHIAILATLMAAFAAHAAPRVIDKAAIYRAAGATRLPGGGWGICEADENGRRGQADIEFIRDLNDDGRPEALVTDTSTYCYGMTGVGYQFLSRGADGRWRVLSENLGVPNVLDTRGADNMPDLELAGHGFCFGVHRWNGRIYDLHRHQYDGKPCKPPE